VNDAVAYEAMRELADALTGQRLLQGPNTDEAIADVISIRSQRNTVDGFDRAAVDRVGADLERRLRNSADRK
tara:strand:- start:3950 stop:4165 length:216 start_codon:yes stop_codon:yes gene_type:complete